MLTADERAAMLAKRRKGFKLRRLRVVHMFNRERFGTQHRRLARQLLDVIDLSRDDAAVAVDRTREGLRTWLFKHTGSTVWPPSAEQLKKLHDMCK